MQRQFTCKTCGVVFVRRGIRERLVCSKACRNPARPVAERFWEKVRKTEGCWLWSGTINRTGYGMFFVSKTGEFKRTGAHRMAWQLTNGVIPDGLHVCHRCDNPPCVRPDHLFLGTDADNHADKAAKGRAPRGKQASINRMPWLYPIGERKHNAKLTEDAVREIRVAHANGAGPRELGRRFGVTHSAIIRVVRGTGWKHVQ